jgi:competence protein ComEC
VELQKKIITKPIDILARILAAERNRLVLWTPVFLALGIGFYFSLEAEPPVWLGPSAFAISGMAWWLLRGRAFLRLAAMGLLLACAGFSLIGLRTAWQQAPAIYSTLYFRTIQGVVEDIEQREKGEKLLLSHVSIERISPHTTPPRIGVTLKNKTTGIHIGDKVELQAMLFPPPSPTMPGAYDFSRQYYYDQVGAVGFSPKPPVVLEHAAQLDMIQWLTDLRLSINARILETMSPQNGPVAAALMVGEQSAITDEVREAMRDSGLYHVLSISGLHMSLAAGLLYLSLRVLLTLYPPLALRWPTKKIAASIGLLGAFIYLLLAGYPVPAVRSFVMVACVMLAILCDRRGISLYSLSWAATLILLVQPEALIGVSFQLSFAATLAIIAFYERYAYLLKTEGRGLFYKLRLYFFGLMATSLMATLATTPLVIYHFNRFTLLGLAANMLMMPLASFMIMPAAVLSFLAMPFGLEAWPLSWLDIGIGWMIDCARWFTSMPEGAFAVPPLGLGGMLLTVFGGLWLCLMAGRWRFYGVIPMLAGMCSIALHQPYDLLIGNDGKKVALRMENGEFVLLKGRSSSYDAESWLRYHGKETAAKLSDLSPASGRHCEGKWCSLTAYGKTIAISTGKDAYKAVCSVKADIIISDNYIKQQDCVGSAQVIDRKFLYQNGAIAFRFKEGRLPMLYTAEAERRYRPWSSNWHYQLYHRH